MKEKTVKLGRPRVSREGTGSTPRVSIRLDPYEKRYILAAADLKRSSLSEFFRKTAMKEAKSILGLDIDTFFE